MLKDEFYRISSIVESSETSACVRIWLNPEHPVYGGHFPGHPVTPGACMVQILRELVADCLQRKVRLSEARQIKFLDILIPDGNAELEFRFNIKTENLDEFIVSAMIADDANTYMKFNGKFVAN